MGRKKKESNLVKKSNNTGKGKSFYNLNFNRQPIVYLNRLNFPASFKSDKTNDFTINVKSKSFEQLFNHTSTHQNKFNKTSSQSVKQIMKVHSDNSQYSDTKSNSFLTDKANKQTDFVPTLENDNTLFEKNVEENIDHCISNKKRSCIMRHSGNKENKDSGARTIEVKTEFGDTDENTYPEDDPAESITRTDMAIDTFLSVLRKTTDDDSILSALQRDYICGLCEKGFLRKGSLRKHVVICSLGRNGKKSKKIKQYGIHSCPVCGVAYLNKWNLDKHNANVHNLKKIYKCLVCSQHFYNEEALTLHCRRRHGLGGSDIYKCPYCEASFSFRGDLNYHCRKAHKTAKFYVCSKCLECFKSEDTCKLHEQSHGFCCDICMYKTKNKSEINAHKLTHLHIVVYKCGRCSRTFKAKRYFTKHIKVHESEKKLF